MLSLLTGCELIAGLDGTRRPGAASGAGAGGTAGSQLAFSGSNNGGSAGAALPTAGRGGAPPRPPDTVSTEQGGEPSSGGGGEGGLSGSGGDSALAGAGGEPNVEEPSPLTTPSCAGPTPGDCGGVDPCITLRVPGGSFQMGRNEDGTRSDYYPTGSAEETPEHPVSLDPYWLDKYEVTVARFRRFVDAYAGPPAAGAGANPHVEGSGWQPEWNSHLPADRPALLKQLADGGATGLIDTWSDDPGTGECRPINFIDWYLAFAFCVWDDGRLPSEAEWEFAASGGAEERLFPWGNQRAPSGRAVYSCLFSGARTCADGDLPHVGSLRRGDGHFGHADLAGSMAEPVRDQYVVGFYALPSASGQEPMDLQADTLGVFSPLRGGGLRLRRRAATQHRTPRFCSE